MRCCMRTGRVGGRGGGGGEVASEPTGNDIHIGTTTHLQC